MVNCWQSASATCETPLVPPPGVGADQDIEIRVRKNGYRPVTYVENLGWAGTAGTLYLWLSLLPE